MRLAAPLLPTGRNLSVTFNRRWCYNRVTTALQPRCIGVATALQPVATALHRRWRCNAVIIPTALKDTSLQQEAYYTPGDTQYGSSTLIGAFKLRCRVISVDDATALHRRWCYNGVTTALQRRCNGVTTALQQR